MYKLLNKKGMTLVEIMIAFALLAIMVSAFLLIFSGSLVNILNFGTKSKTLATANQAMEAVYSIQEADQALIEAELDAKGGNKVTIEDNLDNYISGSDFNYFVEPTDNGVSVGYKVSITYFYSAGQKYVELVSFVKGSD